MSTIALSPSTPLRPVYTAQQFASEVLAGNRTRKWVCDQCAAKRIKSITRKPYLIPQAEALRFIHAT